MRRKILYILLLGWIATAQNRAPQQPELDLARVVALQGTTYHVQGIDFDAQRLWVTSVDTAARKGYLHQFTFANGKLERTIEIQQGDRFHPGGISTDADSIWIPVAEYRRASSAVIERRNKRTLDLESRFEVPDHIGCIAVTPEGLIGGNWDSRKFYIWNQRGEKIREIDNPTDNAYQDIKFDAGALVASGLLPDRSGAIDWLEYPSLKLIRRVKPGNTDRGAPYTREGMAVRGSDLLLLPEDGPSRLFVFRLKP